MLIAALASVALAAPPSGVTVSDSVAGAQRTGWTGVGFALAGDALLLTGSTKYYTGVFQAVDRVGGGTADPVATDPSSALGSSLLVQGGLGTSALGRTLGASSAAFGAVTLRRDGVDVSPVLGWTAVGAWAAGTTTWLTAVPGGSDGVKWAWLGLRAASVGATAGQLVLNGRAFRDAGGVATRDTGRTSTVSLSMSPSGAWLSGRF